MGTSHSSRRRHQQHQQQPTAVIVTTSWVGPSPPPPPPGYSDAGGPFAHQFSPYYGGGYYGGNHHHYVQQLRPPPPPPPPLPLPLPPPPPPPPPALPPVPAQTVRNDVNLNKATLRLERDQANPEHHLVAFSFDATAAGSISVFFMAREASDGSVRSLSSLFPKPQRFHFSEGLGQKYKQETGLDFSLIDEADLSKVGSGNVYPLIIRIETVPKNPPSTAESPEQVGGPLRKWIHCQQTYATIEKKEGGEYNVKVVKQIIWIEGVRYELKEIYGIAPSEVNNSSSSSDDSGKDCVICLSEPKDTTVLPCRHMCMCSDCANVLRNQTNLCPICRCPVEELLQIKVPDASAAA